MTDPSDDPDYQRYRQLVVPDRAAGMRLDRLLSKRFMDLSRTSLVKAIRQGLVTDDDGKVLRASSIVRAGDVLRLYIPGLAPDAPPPPFPPVLYEDDRLLVVDKPAGLLAHPGGTRWAWAVVSLAKKRYPHENLDLVHRLDRDTSGVLVMSKDVEANRFLRARLLAGEVYKSYLALCKGRPDFDTRTVEGPIGRAGGEVRIQMAVREDGLSARTDIEVLERHPVYPLSRISCRIHTGRTHRIRVHLDSVGHALLGDRLYGVGPEVFLGFIDDAGPSPAHVAAAGAPRQALHCAQMRVAHPDGGELDVRSSWPDDLTKWWQDPQALPWPPLHERDAAAPADAGSSAHKGPDPDALATPSQTWNARGPPACVWTLSRHARPSSDPRGPT